MSACYIFDDDTQNSSLDNPGRFTGEIQALIDSKVSLNANDKSVIATKKKTAPDAIGKTKSEKGSDKESGVETA